MISGRVNQIWIVRDKMCRTFINDVHVKFATFVEDGEYLDHELEIVWQIKGRKEEWWENVVKEPDEETKKLYDVRRLARLFTGDTEMVTQFNSLARTFSAFGITVNDTLLKDCYTFLDSALKLIKEIGASQEEATKLLIYLLENAKI